jgi:hypothetical protein
LARPDVPVFPLAAVARLGLRLPCQGVADSHPDAASLLDEDHDVVRRACLDTVDAIPEVPRGRLDRRPVWAAEKLAGREPRLADAVLAHLGSASTAFLGLPAWVDLEGHWALLRVAAALCTPDEALSAA